MRTFFFLLIILGFNQILSAQISYPFKVHKIKHLNKKIQEELKGFEVRITNVKYSGAPEAIGEFRDANEIFNMSHGLILSTGKATDAAHSNDTKGQTTAFKQKSHPALKGITNAQLYDAAVLEFDFYPNAPFVSFNFVFASEDYPEFVPSNYSDVLAFILTLPNGQQVNLATLPDTNLWVQTSHINAQNNAQYFINNYEQPPYPIPAPDSIFYPDFTLVKQYQVAQKRLSSPTQQIQYDGLTKVMQAIHAVEPNQKHRLQIAIADRGNPMYDSAVFIEMGSLHSHKSPDYKAGILAKNPSYYYTLDTIFNPAPLTENHLTHHKEDITCFTNYPDIMFDYDSPELSPSSHEWLQTVVYDLQKCPNHVVRINGFAAAENNDAYNNALSKERSERVRAYLVKYGVPKDKIELKWHGDANAKTKKELLKNRRVHVEIVPVSTPKEGRGGKL